MPGRVGGHEQVGGQPGPAELGQGGRLLGLAEPDGGKGGEQGVAPVELQLDPPVLGVGGLVEQDPAQLGRPPVGDQRTLEVADLVAQLAPPAQQIPSQPWVLLPIGEQQGLGEAPIGVLHLVPEAEVGQPAEESTQSSHPVRPGEGVRRDDFDRLAVVGDGPFEPGQPVRRREVLEPQIDRQGRPLAFVLCPAGHRSRPGRRPGLEPLRLLRRLLSQLRRFFDGIGRGPPRVGDGERPQGAGPSERIHVRGT